MASRAESRASFLGVKQTAVRNLPLRLAMLLAMGIALSLIFGERPDYAFKEGRPFTLLSGVLLILLGLVAFRIYRARAAHPAAPLRDLTRGAPASLWLFIGGGFIYLALDELISIHESIGDLIQAVFGIAGTTLGESVDGLVLLLYALIGVAIAAHPRFRREMRLLLVAPARLIAATAMFLVMVVADVLSETREPFIVLFDDAAAANVAYLSVATAEEVAKLMSEAYLLLWLLAARDMALRTFRSERVNKVARPASGSLVRTPAPATHLELVSHRGQPRRKRLAKK